MNGRKLTDLELFCQPHERWPQSAVDVGHLAADEPAYQNVR